MKNPLTAAGIEPATFRFVAQHLNHCAAAVPDDDDDDDNNNNNNRSRLCKTWKYGTAMCRLTTGIRSEKCVVRRFRRCANVIECTYTKLHT